MPIMIGHASKGEDGFRKQKPGDQTKKEVCIRDWWDDEWNVLIRPASKDMAEKMAQYCIQACANDNIGYDMKDRNTLYKELKKHNWDFTAVGPCECDCSSLMTCCAIASGAKIRYGFNAPVTSTMREVFEKTGQFEILTEARFLRGTEWIKPGDILVSEGKHTVCVLGDDARGDLEGVDLQACMG